MKEKILYLREMGMNDPKISTDIKNHRVRVLENIDIEYKGTAYNMFFEFMQCDHYRYRTTNKRTGAPLKHGKRELIQKDSMAIDTQFEKTETDIRNGAPYTWQSSWRKSDLESEFWQQHLPYTRENVLKVVNSYIVGPKYTKVVLIEEAARAIIETDGGYREKEIIADPWTYASIETWSDDHKVVKFIENVKTETAPGIYQYLPDRSCEVDLITGTICG